MLRNTIRKRYTGTFDTANYVPNRIRYNESEMKTAAKKYVWMVMALLALFQAAMPALVNAQVTMRCADQPFASSQRCESANVAVTHTLDIRKAISSMPCCCRAMQMGVPCGIATAVAARKCLISVRYSTTQRPPVLLNRNRWMLGSAPALAPPDAPLTIGTPSESPIHFDFGDFTHSVSKIIVSSHGLRAPPVS